jgi:hypothetical protein
VAGELSLELMLMLEFVRDAEFARRFGQGESVQSITQGEGPLEF